MHGSGQNAAEMTGVAKMRPEWAGQMNRMTGTEGTATPTPKRAGQGRMKMDMPQRKAMATETLNTDREGGEAGERPTLSLSCYLSFYLSPLTLNPLGRGVEPF